MLYTRKLRAVSSSHQTQLATSCRILRGLLDQPVPPTLKMVAPHVAAALPVLREFVAGVEDLADSVSLMQADARQQRERFAATRHPAAAVGK